MLTIQNKFKILNKTLGKKNFYVENVKEIFDMDAATFSTKNNRYQFDITNRKYSITIMLDRDETGRDGNFDYKLHSSTGHILYINLLDIRNMDIFIDKLRFVALGNFK